jgi:hypothetical protein
MLDIIWKNESLHNDVITSDSIPNICVQGENSLVCDLPSDESIADTENLRSVIWGMVQHTFSVC